MSTAEIDIVRRTAALADLELSLAEAERLGPQFARILDAFRALEALDVSGVEAMVRGAELLPRTREDDERPSLPAEAVLALAPAREGAFYGVPKTLGDAP